MGKPGTMRCIFTAVVFVLLASAFGAGQSREKLSEVPDVLLTNAHAITMNPAQPVAQVIAIRGGKIVWVGTNEQARDLFPADVKRVDLNGATVLPGIIDAHTHLAPLGESLLRLNLKDLSEDQVLQRVKQRVASANPGEWILGWGWDEGQWASHYPTHEALDAVAPNNPVFLVGLHGYAAWVNQKALQLAGVTRQTKDPANGTILRDEKSGEPTGVLLNHAQELVSTHLPPASLDHVKQAITVATAECVRNGLTAVHEAQVSALELQALRALLAEGRLPVRVYVMLDAADHALVSEWLKRGPEIDPDQRLTIRAFKLFADGALGSRGASLLEPYADAPQTKGVVTTPEADIYQLTRDSLQKGFQVCTHAIGDAANRTTLDAYARALKEVPQAVNARLRIEHAQVLSPEDIPRFKELGVIASMQPTHATSDMKWAETRLGPQRIKGAYAWRSVLKTGAHLPLSSDFPGETLNPFFGMYAAVTRQDASGNPPGGWYPEQRLTLDEALRGYTIEAAYAGFEEATKGSIEKGKLADMTIVAEDLTTVPTKSLLNVHVLKTIVGGKVVYDSANPNSNGK